MVYYKMFPGVRTKLFLKNWKAPLDQKQSAIKLQI